MKVTERISKDQRLSWNRKGGVVLVVFLERATVEHTVARLGELARLPDVDLHPTPHGGVGQAVVTS
jgi:hypothetical protein